MNAQADTAQGCGEYAPVGRATKAPTTILSSSHVVTCLIPSSPQGGGATAILPSYRGGKRDVEWLPSWLRVTGYGVRNPYQVFPGTELRPTETQGLRRPPEVRWSPRHGDEVSLGETHSTQK